uniref:Uncharacterized protein n=2 Tax=Caenorhabditis japonica TaxID=281687 RepID=A0A8R1IP10_CAEJA
MVTMITGPSSRHGSTESTSSGSSGSSGAIVAGSGNRVVVLKRKVARKKMDRVKVENQSQKNRAHQSLIALLHQNPIIVRQYGMFFEMKN